MSLRGPRQGHRMSQAVGRGLRMAQERPGSPSKLQQQQNNILSKLEFSRNSHVHEQYLVIHRFGPGETSYTMQDTRKTAKKIGPCMCV